MHLDIFNYNSSRRVGFGQRWLDLFCLILSTASTQVLVNGVPGDTIFHHRGLRQGDPLSPMLFILVMDVLNSLVQFATTEGLLQPLAVQQARHRVSVYADDAVISWICLDMFPALEPICPRALCPRFIALMRSCPSQQIFCPAPSRLSPALILSSRSPLAYQLKRFCCLLLIEWQIISLDGRHL